MSALKRTRFTSRNKTIKNITNTNRNICWTWHLSAGSDNSLPQISNFHKVIIIKITITCRARKSNTHVPNFIIVIRCWIIFHFLNIFACGLPMHIMKIFNCTWNFNGESVSKWHRINIDWSTQRISNIRRCCFYWKLVCNSWHAWKIISFLPNIINIISVTNLSNINQKLSTNSRQISLRNFNFHNLASRCVKPRYKVSDFFWWNRNLFNNSLFSVWNITIIHSHARNMLIKFFASWLAIQKQISSCIHWIISCVRSQNQRTFSYNIIFLFISYAT